MNKSDSIVSMLYIKRDILESRAYYFCNWKSVSKYIENIKERIAKFKVIKEEFGQIKPHVTCYIIAFHCGRMNWELLLKIMKNMFRWKILLLVEIWWAQENYLNEPEWSFRIRTNGKIWKHKYYYWQYWMLVWSWWLESNEIKKGKYTPGNIYNQMKEIFIKDWKEKRLLGLHSSEVIPNLTNHKILKSNIKCGTCTRQLWNYT